MTDKAKRESAKSGLEDGKMSFKRALCLAHNGRRQVQSTTITNQFPQAVLWTARRMDSEGRVKLIWLSISAVFVALAFAQLGADMTSRNR